MGDGIWRYLISGAFLMHGLGMLGGAIMVALVGEAAERNGFGQSWLLSKGGAALQSTLGVLIWGAAGAGFVAAAAGFYLDQAWWTNAAWVGAPATLLAIALWAGAVPPGTYAGGALAVATIVYLLVLP